MDKDELNSRMENIESSIQDLRIELIRLEALITLAQNEASPTLANVWADGTPHALHNNEHIN